MLKKQILEKLSRVKDPEIGIDIVALGLIREIRLPKDGVEVVMTLTSPFCPFGNEIISAVEKSVREVLPEGNRVEVEITFNPPWEPPEELRPLLGI